jgi:hypothetical protein
MMATRTGFGLANLQEENEDGCQVEEVSQQTKQVHFFTSAVGVVVIW